MEEIRSQGEWEFVFFHKKFSHAVIKMAKEGEFRVQDMYGGSSIKKDPPPVLLAQAQRIVDSVKSPVLYTRVDGLEINAKFLLMELELIEPTLYLQDDPLAAGRFAAAIQKVLRKSA
jgi:hypothetical protein